MNTKLCVSHVIMYDSRRSCWLIQTQRDIQSPSANTFLWQKWFPVIAERKLNNHSILWVHGVPGCFFIPAACHDFCRFCLPKSAWKCHQLNLGWLSHNRQVKRSGKSFYKGNISSGERADSQTPACVHTSDHFSLHLSPLQGSEGSLCK